MNTSTHEASHGYISDKDRYLARMKRIEGQARGIHRMIDEDTYCIDILTQISAVTAALENVALGLLDDHLKHCVTAAIRDGDLSAEAKIKEASDAIARLVKSYGFAMLALLRTLTPSIVVRDVEVSAHRCCQAMRWLVTIRFARGVGDR